MQQLTPYLRRRVLHLPVADRVELMQAIGASIAAPPKPDRLGTLRDAMLAVSGVDVRDQRRFADHVRARSVYCFVARMEGFSLAAIGEALGMDHSSVHYLAKRMGDAFSSPAVWSDYLDTYDRFVKELAI